MSVSDMQVSFDAGQDLRRASEFLYEESDLLDAGDLSAWLALFTQPCLYWIPAGGKDYDPYKSPSLIFDEHPRLTERVHRILTGTSFCQSPPSLTHHMVTNVAVRDLSATEATQLYPLPPVAMAIAGGLDDQLLLVRSKQQITELHHGRETPFRATCTHLLVADGDDIRILLKRIDLLRAGEPIFDLTFLL